MAHDVMAERREVNGLPALFATDPVGIDTLREIGMGEMVRCQITRPRNVKHHRMFFALMQVVFQAQTHFATLEGMLDAIKIATGHFEEIKGLDGCLYIKPKSIAFANMGQDSFKEFYNKALDLILTKILPMTDREDLEQAVFDILREPGPNQLRR